MDLVTRTRMRLRVTVGVLVVLTLAGMAALWPRAADLPETTDPPPAAVSGVVRDVQS